MSKTDVTKAPVCLDESVSEIEAPENTAANDTEETEDSADLAKKKKKKEIFRFLKYACVACSAAVVELGSFALLNETMHLEYWVSYLTALILSVIWAFTINRRYTFASTANIPKAMLLVLAYYLVFTPTTTWLENFLTVGCGWNEYLVTCINMALNMTTEYLYQRLVVFRRTIDTNSVAQRRAAKEESK